jgi:hypothetical protein
MEIEFGFGCIGSLFATSLQSALYILTLNLSKKNCRELFRFENIGSCSWFLMGFGFVILIVKVTKRKCHED